MRSQVWLGRISYVGLVALVLCIATIHMESWSLAQSEKVTLLAGGKISPSSMVNRALKIAQRALAEKSGHPRSANLIAKQALEIAQQELALQAKQSPIAARHAAGSAEGKEASKATAAAGAAAPAAVQPATAKITSPIAKAGPRVQSAAEEQSPETEQAAGEQPPKPEEAAAEEQSPETEQAAGEQPPKPEEAAKEGDSYIYSADPLTFMSRKTLGWESDLAIPFV